MKILRNALPLVLCAGVSVAHAQVTFSSINATYSMSPGSGTINWQVFPDGADMSIDFVQNAPAFKVGDSTSYVTGASSITYDVVGTNISSASLLLQGDVEDFGRIQFSETATSGGTQIGSTSGSILGASYTGGANGAFTNVYQLTFAAPVNSFSITQTMTSDINGQSVPSSSLALVGIVEQNFSAVPEPATITGLAIGAIALIRRKKTK